MRSIVDLAWLALLAFMLATAHWMPDVLDAPADALSRRHDLALMIGAAVGAPWLAIRGALLAARHSPALLSLPDKDDWLASERREQTLAALTERLAVLSLLLALLGAGVHGFVVARAHLDWPQPPDAAWVAGGIALTLAVLAWAIAFIRYFSRPRPVRAASAVRRRTSRNGDVLWRESQPMWLLLPILAGSAWFAAQVARTAHAGTPVFVFTVVASVALLCGRLVVELRGDSLRWHYGWLGWPRWRLDLDDIAAVEPAHSRWFEGRGIRSTGEGMLYNSHGLRAVRLTLRDGRRLRVGTRQPEHLTRLLRDRLAAG